jgi:type IV secretory pathway VirB2 component (pilin)
MNGLRRFVQSPVLKRGLVLLVFMLLVAAPAFADLESGMVDLQGKIRTICTPLAIIFIMIAGWQKAMGNDHLFVAALIGTVVMFAAPQIVPFISSVFGG